MVPVLRLSALFAVVFVLLLSIGVTGCAHTRQREPQRVVRVAVLNGTASFPVAVDGEIIDEGWWLGARDRYFNPNTGVQLADTIARETSRIPGVEVFSREDLAIYMAQKERLLRRQFPELTSLQRKQVLADQSPIDYGRSLNVDFVVTSDVRKSSTVVNRTFSWWYSHARVIVEVHDVHSGQRIWAEEFSRTRAFSSQFRVFQGFGRKAANRFRREDVFGTAIAPRM